MLLEIFHWMPYTVNLSFMGTRYLYSLTNTLEFFSGTLLSYLKVVWFFKSCIYDLLGGTRTAFHPGLIIPRYWSKTLGVLYPVSRKWEGYLVRMMDMDYFFYTLLWETGTIPCNSFQGFVAYILQFLYMQMSISAQGSTYSGLWFGFHAYLYPVFSLLQALSAPSFGSILWRRSQELPWLYLCALHPCTVPRKLLQCSKLRQAWGLLICLSLRVTTHHWSSQCLEYPCFMYLLG